MSMALLMMLSFPVLVKAENKVYFELDEVNIAPSEEKKINVYDINYLIIETLGNNVLNNNEDYHDYKVIMNGDYIRHNDKTIDLVNKDELGKYIILMDNVYKKDGNLTTTW